MQKITAEIIDWMETTLGAGARFLYARELRGSTSATLYRVIFLQKARVLHCVLRLFTNAEWLAQEPDIPEHEAAALLKVHPSGLPVPRLHGCDERGKRCGLPAILMTEVPGRVDMWPVDIDSWLRQQAQFIARLHEIAPGNFAWKYRPYYKVAQLQPPKWSGCPDLWRKAIQIVQSPAPKARICFIHRDYHPVNVLWRHGKLSGVVDWVNSCVGPAGVDAAWCRHNLAGAYGVEMADRFLEICEDEMGFDEFEHQAYWDLQTLLELLPGPFEVYPPWRELGLKHVTDALFTQRIEEYLQNLVRKF